MTNFVTLDTLPDADQKEIARIQAIPSGERNVVDTAYLVSRAPYLTNEILEVDPNGLILKARGETLPDLATGFAKGAFFYDTTATDTSGVSINVGDEEEASFLAVTNEAPE